MCRAFFMMSVLAWYLSGMELIELPVMYKGEELMLAAQIRQFGYSYKLIVDIGGVEIAFEKDDSGEFRAILEQGEHVKMDIGLIKAVVDTLNALK